MKTPVAVTVTILAFCAFRCAGTFSESDTETRAGYHMRLADSLQTELALRAATMEYTTVAQLYPQSGYYADAVRNAALLYSNPLNPLMNDSLSLYWFERYLSLRPPREERAKAEVYVTMLNRIMQLRAEITRRNVVGDSLQSILRRQAGELTARSRRVSDLENELQRTNDELRRLREVDIRINRRKGK
jgi:hypothetical protein